MTEINNPLKWGGFSALPFAGLLDHIGRVLWKFFLELREKPTCQKPLANGRLSPRIITKLIEDYFTCLKSTEVPTAAWSGLFSRSHRSPLFKARGTVVLMGEKSAQLAEHLDEPLKEQGCLLRTASHSPMVLHTNESFLRNLERDVWYGKISTLFVVSLVDSQGSSEWKKTLDLLKEALHGLVEKSPLIRSYIQRGDLVIDQGLFDLNRHQFLTVLE